MSIFKKIHFKIGEFFFGFENGDNWKDIDSGSLIFLSIFMIATGFGIGTIFSVLFY